MAAKTHKDVEFVVENVRGKQRTFRRFDDAAGFAVQMAASDGKEYYVDVLIYSKSGARWWGGSYAVEEYEADPDASVSERIAVKAESQGSY